MANSLCVAVDVLSFLSKQIMRKRVVQVTLVLLCLCQEQPLAHKKDKPWPSMVSTLSAALHPSSQYPTCVSVLCSPDRLIVVLCCTGAFFVSLFEFKSLASASQA